ncbi:MAG: hypothetical protein M3468_12750, partial [Acidobacteriota bacterium]|nr:hypothetical protein [Acidobacteriota bacterium]
MNAVKTQSFAHAIRQHFAGVFVALVIVGAYAANSELGAQAPADTPGLTRILTTFSAAEVVKGVATFGAIP